MRTEWFVLVIVMLCSVAATVADAAPNRLEAAVERLEQQVAAQAEEIGQLKNALRGERFKSTVNTEMRELLKDMGPAVARPAPSWLDNLKFSGDLRLRYHYETFGSSSDKDVSKGRFRLRLGAKKTWWEKQMEIGFRLASGSSDDPSSTNQTFDGNMSEKHVWIDLAYAKWRPDALKGMEFGGGKMKNPFVHTNMIWDSDVNPEGVWAVGKCPVGGPVQPFVGTGWFLLEESGSGHNGTLHAYQGGVTVNLAEDVTWVSAVSYYDFKHYEETYARSGGNTSSGGLLTAEEFDVVNLTNTLKWKSFGLPMSAYVDLAQNCDDEVDDDTNDAYAVGVKVGKNEKKGDVSGKYKYAYIEANASPGAFNDSDFGHSNSKGHQVGLAYNIADFLMIGANLFYTQVIRGDATGDPRFLGLFDLIWKF